MRGSVRLAGYVLRSVVGLIPGKSALEAFFEEDGGFVAEKFLGKANVGEGVADVAFAGGFVFCFESLARGFLKHLENLVERDGVAGADVEGSAGGAGGFAGENVGLDGVVHVGEVAGLFAVAEDDGRSGIEEGRGKAGKYARVRRVG